MRSERLYERYAAGFARVPVRGGGGSITEAAIAAGGEGQTLYVFVSERGAPLSIAGYQCMIYRAGKAAKFPFLIHSHMSRHSTGYKLANAGQDTRAIQGYLGHRLIMSTQRYTALAPDTFKRFWKD